MNKGAFGIRKAFGRIIFGSQELSVVIYIFCLLTLIVNKFELHTWSLEFSTLVSMGVVSYVEDLLD